MTQPTAPLGFESFAYYNTGTFASPVWAQIKPTRDVTLNLDRAEIDTSLRGDAGYKSSRAGMAHFTFDIEMQHLPADASFSVLQGYFFNRTQAEFLLLDGPSTMSSGAQGVRCYCEVTKFARKEPLDGALTIDMQLVRAYSATYTTSWYTA